LPQSFVTTRKSSVGVGIFRSLARTGHASIKTNPQGGADVRPAGAINAGYALEWDLPLEFDPSSVNVVALPRNQLYLLEPVANRDGLFAGRSKLIETSIWPHEERARSHTAQHQAHLAHFAH
jgi:hypothetical protein